MLAGWTALVTSLGYLCILFAIAHFGDLSNKHFSNRTSRVATYVLGLCIYCTSWTFFGSVGLASKSGWDFFPVYLGPILVFLFGRRVIIRVLRLSKAQNITSIADFLATRYGKSEAVAAVVAVIAVVGIVPYLALQLQAVSESLAIVTRHLSREPELPATGGFSFSTLLVGTILSVFAMAFGTRQLKATEHQDGLMLAIATESVVKLLAFLAVGLFVVYGMFNGMSDLLSQAATKPGLLETFTQWPDPATFATITLLSACAIFLLPRQFHVAIVENRSEGDVHKAARLFPAYLILINIFVVPLAIAGLVLTPEAGVNRDMTVLMLPLVGGSTFMALVAMIGGISAATAMVIVSAIALSIMVSNDLIIPLFLRARTAWPHIAIGNITRQILLFRRLAIVAVIGLACLYVHFARVNGLAAIGLLSFAAIAQLAPAFIGSLFWSRANARGALAGLITGTAIWTYTLLLPSLGFGVSELARLHLAAWLNPTALFGLDLPTLVHGTLFSLSGNILAFVGFSFSRRLNAIESLQASIFVSGSAAPAESRFRLWQPSIGWGELEAVVARYMGPQRTRLAFAEFANTRPNWQAQTAEADLQLMRFAEQTLTSVIGAASSRLVLSLALQRQNLSYKAAQDLADEASAAIHYNRDLLQHAIDFARQGISIFDAKMCLVFWNREFRDIFEYAPDLLQVGTELDDLLRFNARNGWYGINPTEQDLVQRREIMVNTVEPIRLAFPRTGNVVELRASRMPDGGLVVTYTDISEQVEAEQALASINETLEQRVKERTEELIALNAELERAKAAAEEANLSKTRFFAAASHDILQPLNAARLFATALTEHLPSTGPLRTSETREARNLVRNVDASLESVEEILTTLLDMSRLDAGAMKPEVTPFRIDDILSQLQLEFGPLAREKQLKLRFAPCSLTVRSDRRLLRRLLQNLVSNAIKYTPEGGVLVGCRRRRGRLLIEVWDSGLGIPENKRKLVFREFERLDLGANSVQGVGLGLSIVERLARVLNMKINLRSHIGKGSVFSVEVPVAPSLPAQPGVADGSGTRARHQPLAGMCIVALDNEPRILEGMHSLMVGWGCTPIAAKSLKAAEQALANSRLIPSAIIADYHLGDISGIEAIVALRWKFGAELPAVLLTADRTQAVRLEAESKNIKLLNKPLKPAALRSLLTQWRMTRVAAE